MAIANKKVNAGKPAAPAKTYRLEEQAGFLLRRAHQRASAIFQEIIEPDLVSPLQFAVLIKLRDEGSVSQNHLGRLTYMDPATVMGVIQRLEVAGLIKRASDPKDKRRTTISLSAEGFRLARALEERGHMVSAQILAPLTPAEQTRFLTLLQKLT